MSGVAPRHAGERLLRDDARTRQEFLSIVTA